MDDNICSDEYSDRKTAEFAITLLHRMDLIYQDLEPLQKQVEQLQDLIATLEKQWHSLGGKSAQKGEEVNENP